MDWFWQLRGVLPDYYPEGTPQDIVGYLRGSADPKVWWRMTQADREQMLILGSVPPTEKEWAAAGVANRGEVQTIRFADMPGFLITYGGFMVTRPWGKISLSSPALLKSYGITLSQFKASLPKPAVRNQALTAVMNAVIDNIARKMDQTSGEHKIQAGLIAGSQGDFTGFFGYWTNHLFNTDIPPQGIWDQCFADIAHARSTLKEGKFADAGKAIIDARDELLKATGIYYRWKDGIQGAGVKMQIAIGAAAVTLIFAAVAATVATAGAAAAAGAGATEGAGGTVTVEGLTSLVTKADTLLVRVVTTAPGGVTAPSAVAYEQALEELAEGTQQLLRMVQ